MGDIAQKKMSVFTKIALARKKQQVERRQVEKQQGVIKEKKTIAQRCGIWTVLWIAFISIIIGVTWTYFFEHKDLIFSQEKVIYQRIDTVASVNPNTANSDAVVGDSLNGSGEVNSSPSIQELSLDEKICKTFPEDCEIMIAISKAENSKRDPFAVGYNKDGSIDVGIFQINSIHGYDKEYLFDIDNNIKVAREIYDREGKEAWVAYNTNKHLAYL